MQQTARALSLSSSPCAVRAPVARRRVPDHGRGARRGGGVAHLQPRPPLRLPRLRQRHQVTRPHTRPEVSAVKLVCAVEPISVIDIHHSDPDEPAACSLDNVERHTLLFQVLAGRPLHRLRGRVPHRLQPMAPRVPAALLRTSN